MRGGFLRGAREVSAGLLKVWPIVWPRRTPHGCVVGATPTCEETPDRAVGGMAGGGVGVEVGCDVVGVRWGGGGGGGGVGGGGVESILSPF